MHHVESACPKSFAVILCLISLLAFSAYAQESRSSITGTVMDQTGAAVPGASIVARHLGTNAEVRSESTQTGTYLLPLLNPGMYTITASASGFKTEVRNNLELRSSDKLQIDISLQIGTGAEQVTVTAEAPLLEATNAIRSTVIDSKKISDLPLLGKNTYSFALYANGVLNINPQASISNRPYDNGGMDAISINGGRAFTNEYLLDGAPNTNTERGRPNSLSFVPPPEATEEVRILSNNYDAQYGRTGGGVISANLKSGTNDFHGALYEYWRNKLLNANTFQANRQGQERGPFIWNQPGGTVNGPVRIPKLYDGRNKTFFLFSWEGIFQNIPSNPFQTVPTLEQRQGNFANLRQANGQPILVYDPLTTQQEGNGYTRAPFAGNVIPADRIDPVAQRLLDFIPLPNLPGDPNTGLNNYAPTSGNVVRERYNAFTYKFDQIISQNHRFSAYYVKNRRRQTGAHFGWPEPALGPNYFERFNQGSSLQLTSTLSPTLVLTSRFGFTQHIFLNQANGGGFDPTQLGFPANQVAQAQGRFFPRIDFDADYQDFGGAGNNADNSTNWYYTASANKVLGSHSIKFGGEVRALFDNLPNYSFATFEFSRGFTQRNPAAGDAGSGNNFASFLLGYASGGNAPYNASPAFGNRYYGLYFQDDWRILRNLTLNLGGRWDYESPVTERYNRLNAGFDPNSPSPLTPAGLQLRGGVLFTSEENRLPYKRDLNNFQPRLGMAWQVTGRTVVRGGYGLSYVPTFIAGQTFGFSTATPYVASTDANLTPASRISNPFPNGILTPTGAGLGLATFAGQPFDFISQERTTPYIHQYSIGFQHELPGRIVVDTSYVGSRTYKLGTTRQINEISEESMALGTTYLNQSVPNPFAGTLPGTGLNTPNTTRRQLLRPFPQFMAIRRMEFSNGRAWYNALQLQVQKRFSGGFHMTLNYTWSATMEAVSYLNPQFADNQLESVRTADDLPHRAAIFGGYEFPFFKEGGGWKRALFGGWQVNGIALFQSGRMLGGVGDAYPTGVDPRIDGPKTPDGYFFNACTLSTAGVRQNCASADQPVAWVQRQPDTLRVTSSRLQQIREIRRPILDSSLFKTFYPMEGMQVQFRFESFNTFNSPWFGQANTTLGNARFGLLGNSQTNDPRNTQVALKITF